MRLALITCLFVVCFGNKVHECGNKVGSCGTPRASLMQVGSSNKRRMSLVSQSASRSGSRVSRALAGFEKYTNNLVSKYVTDRETIPMSEDVIAAIDTVRKYINGLFDSLNESHYHDIDRIQTTCGQDAEDVCINEYFDDTKVQVIQTKKNESELKRKAHVNCRLQEFNDTCQKNLNCIEYDDFRMGDGGIPQETAAKCAFPTDDFGNELGVEQGKLADDFIKTENEQKRGHMETCLKNFKTTWFTRLYELFLACDREDSGEQQVCVGMQGEFEEAHCTHNLELNTTCHNYDVCRKEAKDDCMDDSTGLCQEVEILVSARKAENETGERILCLLTVLVDTENASKKAELDTCTKKTYDTSYFDLDCPGDDGFPEPDPPIECSPEPVSCQASFLDKYYATSQPNDVTGAHLIPYEAVCDCAYKCTALAGEAAEKPVDYEKDDLGNLVCGLLPGYTTHPPRRQCPV